MHCLLGLCISIESRALASAGLTLQFYIIWHLKSIQKFLKLSASTPPNRVYIDSHARIAPKITVRRPNTAEQARRGRDPPQTHVPHSIKMRRSRCSRPKRSAGRAGRSPADPSLREGRESGTPSAVGGFGKVRAQERRTDQRIEDVR